MKKKTHEEYVTELAVKNPDIEVVGQYINANTKITHHCLIHDIYWDITPSMALRGRGCGECGKEKIGDSNRKTHEQYVDELKEVNSNIAIIEVYINALTPILHKCLIDGHEWRVRPNDILKGRGCPKCSNRIRRTCVEYIKEVKKINPDVIVVGDYINTMTAILHKCSIDGHEWYTTPSSILQGCGCPKCAGNLKKTQEEYEREVLIVNPKVEVVGKYIGANIPIMHRCKIHNVKWKSSPVNILRGKGCDKCKSEKIRDNRRKGHEQYVNEIKQINPNICVIGTYIDARTPVLHKCLIDGYEWYARPANILHQGSGCPRCHESSGERQVRQWLEKHNITYIFQQPFEDCRDINPLPFDFYLPDYNSCVEYDHKQHFEPIEHFGGQDTFELQVKHDNIKTEYCKNNGISLLRIPYFKNIEEELNNFLFI